MSGNASTIWEQEATCDPAEHAAHTAWPDFLDGKACRETAALFRALGDEARLTLLCHLMRGERCVTELAGVCGDSLPAVSQRLRLLRSERIVASRRRGKHVFYSVADEHVRRLIAAAIEHASEFNNSARGSNSAVAEPGLRSSK